MKTIAVKIECPACEGMIDHIAFDRWGRPTRQDLERKVAPYICAWCGSLLIVDMEKRTLTIPPPEAIAIMQGNRVLWDHVTRAQAQILALPERRKVIHHGGD